MGRTESLEFLERWLQMQLYLFGGQSPFPGLFGVGIVPEGEQIPGVPDEIPLLGSVGEERTPGKEIALASSNSSSPLLVRCESTA